MPKKKEKAAAKKTLEQQHQDWVQPMPVIVPRPTFVQNPKHGQQTITVHVTTYGAYEEPITSD